MPAMLSIFDNLPMLPPTIAIQLNENCAKDEAPQKIDLNDGGEYNIFSEN